MSVHDEQSARDTADLERFGYKQELKRELHTFSSFAVAFSYISPSTGIFTLFYLGMAAVGAFLFWTWPLVALMQFIVALNFAELSSHFPVAGSVYQWSKYLANRGYAWFTGWFYVIAGILTVASVVATLPLALFPMLNTMFGWHLTADFSTGGHLDQAIAALITLALITILNIYGVKIVAIVNNTGVFFEILGMVVFAVFLAIAHNNQGAGVIFDSSKAGSIFKFPGFEVSFFLVAMFMSLYVIYGFDTASTLAEETKDPRREAPKAVLASVVGAFVVGAIFLWATLMAVPDMGAAIKGAFGPAQIIDANFSNAFATVYLLVVAAAIFVCCLAIQASTIRLCFSMSRDEQLPGSSLLRKVHPRLHTPIGSCIAIGVLAFIPMLQYTGAAIVAIAATGMIYLSYLICNLAVIRARLRGWPRTTAPFSLGKWGIPITALGLLWGGGMLINFAWPRVATNPTPNETGKLLDFHWHWLNDQPILWTVAIFITLVGAVYFLLVQRTKPAYLQAPEGEVFAADQHVAAPASSA